MLTDSGRREERLGSALFQDESRKKSKIQVNMEVIS